MQFFSIIITYLDAVMVKQLLQAFNEPHIFLCYRFIGDDRVFDNGTKYPEKRCYCAKRQIIGSDEISACSEECVPSGVRSISKCRFGAPAFVSFPHFYKADPSYLLNIIGLNPNQDLHEFYVAVEPVSCMT
jgi:hypothetical protein